MYNYSGFDQELTEIEEQGLYLAAPDDAWTDNAMAELIILFQ